MPVLIVSLILSSPSFAQNQSDSQLSLPMLFTPVEKVIAQRAVIKNIHPSGEKEKRSRRMGVNVDILGGLERLSINLFSNTLIEVKVSSAKKNRFGRTVWRGEVENQVVDGVREVVTGKVTLIISDNTVMGTVRMNGQLYKIEPENNQVHSIKEIDTTSYPSDHPNAQSDVDVLSTIPKAMSGDTVASSADAVVNVSVLVLYAASVSGNVSDVNALVDLVIDETNQTYIDSGLNQSLQLSLVGTVAVDFAEMTYPEMLSSLASRSDGVLDDVHQLRLDHEADVVVLLSSESDYCGYGYVGADYDTAFAVVNYACASGNFSFAHEIGHLVGARHDIQNDSSSYPYAYGHGFQSPSLAFRTIMSYNCGNGDCPRVGFWSSPDNLFGDEVMGQADTSNNVRVWEENASHLAGLHEAYIPPDIDRELWFFDIGDYVYSSPVVDDEGTAYFAGRDANIYALYSDMSIKWQTSVSQAISSALVLENGVIYYRTAGPGAREYGALSINTGELLWSQSLSGSGDSPAVTNDGTSYVVDGGLLKQFSSQGELLLSVSVSPTVYAAPIVGESGDVYAMSIDGLLRRFSSSLDAVWSLQIPESYARTCLAMGIDGTVYVPTINGILYAVSRDGELLWEYTFDSVNYDRCPVVDMQGNIIIGGGTKIHAISSAGNKLWESEDLTEAVTSTAAIVDDGSILVGTRTRMNALSSSGVLLWTSLLSLNNQSSVAIADNGIAYIGGALYGAGGLHAYSIDGRKLANTVWPRHHGRDGGSSCFELPVNNEPFVSIESPTDGIRLLATDGPVVLQATAEDSEDGDLSRTVQWQSDVDGPIESPTMLSVGQHRLTVTVIDSGELSGTDTVGIEIIGEADLLVTLVGAPGKNEGGVVTFTATINNIALAPSLDSSIALVLPEGVSFVAADNVVACTELEKIVTCELQDIDVGEESAITFTVSTGEYTYTKHSYQVGVSALNDVTLENNVAVSMFGGSISPFQLLLLVGMMWLKRRWY
ncbi:hypothetical protein A9Q99_10400 [Gammaproteobacteria bacterium 45_16_T64]|nr:hypothetical protein A9Q99_10400 [Gammaproteobacteria bacterium 45_16_T64]